MSTPEGSSTSRCRFTAWLSSRGRLRSTAGFTIPELLVVLTIGGLVVASIIGVVIPQYRDYSRQQELASLRGSLRDALSLIGSELRMLSAAEGDLVEITPNSVVIRSVQGIGVVCDTVPASQPTYGIAHVSGGSKPTVGDSALVYAYGSEGLSDDAWTAFRIQGLSGGGLKTTFGCAWGGDTVAELRLELAGDTAGIGLGSPLRAFRRTEFALFSADGRWWLGRQEGSSSGFDLLAGPMASPADSGLVFIYYDRDGNQTTAASEVASVEMALRGETVRKLWADRVKIDSLRTRVSLRG